MTPSRSPSSAAPACTSWPRSRTSKRTSRKRRYGAPSGPGARRHARRPARRLPRAPWRRPLAAAAPDQLPRQPAPRCRRSARTRVLALNTVGGITERFGPRVLGCPDQLIDYTWGRISTLCEEPGTRGAARRLRRSLHAARCAQAVARCGATCAASRWSTAAATAPPRARAWKPGPRSRACAATAATWSA